MQTLNPLYGAYVTDAMIAKAIPGPPGIYEGFLPSIAGSGGPSGWTLTIAPGKWRTFGDSYGRYLVAEDSALQFQIAGPSSLPRTDLLIGWHKWVVGPTDSATQTPTGAFSATQQAVYTIEAETTTYSGGSGGGGAEWDPDSGTWTHHPFDPIIELEKPTSVDLTGRRPVILAKIYVPTTGKASVSIVNNMAYETLAAARDEVIEARNEFETLKRRIDSITTSTQVEAAYFRATAPATGGGNYQVVTFPSAITWGSAVTTRSESTIGLEKEGLYEIVAYCNAKVPTFNTQLNAFRVTLTHNGTETPADETPDTNADDENQTVYAMVYRDASWTDAFVTLYHDSYSGGSIRGSVKYLGIPNTLSTLGIRNGDMTIQAALAQTWPATTTIGLLASGAVGLVNWAILPGTGCLDATTDPAVTIIPGGGLRLAWTANPGLPRTWKVTLQGTDSATIPRVATKTINLTMAAYAVNALAISTTDKAFALTGVGPFAPSFLPEATGGTTPYTVSIVAGTDTNMPGATIGTDGLVASDLTFTQMNAGPYKVKLRAIDSTLPTHLQVEKTINITTSATLTGGGGGGTDGGGGGTGTDNWWWWWWNHGPQDPYDLVVRMT